MHDYELKHLQQQLDRLNNDVSKQKTGNFIWLIILSNLLFLFFVAHVGLKRDVNELINLVNQKHVPGNPLKKPMV